MSSRPTLPDIERLPLATAARPAAPIEGALPVEGALPAGEAVTEPAGRLQAGPVPEGDLEVVVGPGIVGRRRHRSYRWLSFVIPVALVGTWELISVLGHVPDIIIPPPTMVATTLWHLAQTGVLGHNLLISLRRAALGFLLGFAAGVVLAIPAGVSKIGEGLIDAPMQMARTLPVLALLPLFIVWFGIGETSKIFIIAFGVCFPIYLNLYAGIRSVDDRLIEAATVLKLNRRQLIRHVIVPGALPTALVGIRYGLGIAWLLLVVSEQLNASSGIGYMMVTAQNNLRTDIVIAGLLIYAALGILSDLAVRLLEWRFLRWRRAFGGE